MILQGRISTECICREIICVALSSSCCCLLQVMADPRMRIYESLQAQGLHQSEYASRVMASLPLLKQQRPDQKTTYRFDER